VWLASVFPGLAFNFDHLSLQIQELKSAREVFVQTGPNRFQHLQFFLKTASATHNCFAQTHAHARHTHEQWEEQLRTAHDEVVNELGALIRDNKEAPEVPAQAERAPLETVVVAQRDLAMFLVAKPQCGWEELGPFLSTGKKAENKETTDAPAEKKSKEDDVAAGEALILISTWLVRLTTLWQTSGDAKDV
jgi:hypothetical protein